MIRYITIGSNGRPGRVQVRAQTKTSRFDGLLVSDERIRLLECVVVEGPAQCGKSRALERLAARAEAYWGSERRRRKKGPVRVLLISGREALSDWLTRAHESGCPAPAGQSWARLTTAARIGAVVEWVEREEVRVLLDDAHLLASGSRREAVAIQLLRASPVWWTTASALERIPQSLRLVIQSRGPRVVSLGSVASHDHTVVLIWGLLALCAAAGAWELAGLLSLLLLTRRGRGAAQEAR